MAHVFSIAGSELKQAGFGKNSLCLKRSQIRLESLF